MPLLRYIFVHPRPLSALTYLRRRVFDGYQDPQHRRSSDQIFHFEGVLVRITRGFVVGEHEIYDVELCADKDDLEARIP